MGTDSPWQIVNSGGKNGRSQTQKSRGRGRTSSSSSFTSSSSNFSVLQRENMSLINTKIQYIAESSSSKISHISPSIHLDDILEDHPLYEQIQSYLSTKQADLFTAVAAENTINRPNYEKLDERELILLVENSQICKQNDPWRLLQKHLLTNLYFAGESFKIRAYYESILIYTGSAEIEHHQLSKTTEYVHGYSKIVIKKLISIKDWGMTSMSEKIMSMKDTKISFTYWDYIKAFTQTLYYNNTKHKHMWFLKVCAKVFENQIPNWFIQWRTYHGPTVKILPAECLHLYKE